MREIRMRRLSSSILVTLLLVALAVGFSAAMTEAQRPIVHTISQDLYQDSVSVGSTYAPFDDTTQIISQQQDQIIYLDAKVSSFLVNR